MIADELKDENRVLAKREAQLAALNRDISTAPKLKDLVLYELDNGVSPEWISTKYGHLGATLERVRAFKAALDKQAEAKREREQSARGDREVSEVRPVTDGD